MADRPTAEQKRARILVADPDWQMSFRLHAILAHCYRNNKAARLEAYRSAGIPQMLERAERRTTRKLRQLRKAVQP